MDLRELVRKTLEYRGFTVVSDSDALIVQGSGGEYLVFLAGEGSGPSPQDVSVEGKMMVIALDYDVEPAGDLFWSREDFERTIGMMMLDELLGDMLPDVVSSFEEALAGGGEPVADELPRSSLGREVGSALIEVRELVPFHAISFSMNRERKQSGIIVVDAVDGTPYLASHPLIPVLDPEGKRREPVISGNEASEAGIEFLIEQNTREVEETMEMEGAVTVVEKKLIAPAREDIDYSYLGLFYIPVLFLENEDGTLAIDASGIAGFRKHY